MKKIIMKLLVILTKLVIMMMELTIFDDSNNHQLIIPLNVLTMNPGRYNFDLSKNCEMEQPYSFRERIERGYSGDLHFSASEDNNGNISELENWEKSKIAQQKESKNRVDTYAKNDAVSVCYVIVRNPASLNRKKKLKLGEVNGFEGIIVSRRGGRYKKRWKI